MNTRIFFALALTAPLTAACTDVAVEDDLAAAEVIQLDDAKADLGSTSTFYKVRPDFRRCAAPACGGVFYSLVNAQTTKCLDGKQAESCYAASTDWARLGLDADVLDQTQSALGAGQLLVRATVARKSWGRLGSFGELRPSEAWLGQGANEADGLFTKVADAGVRCITTPCNSMREGKLNSTATAMLAELGWDASGATEEQIATASQELFNGHGLIIAGDRYAVTGRGGKANARTVTNFYQRAINPVRVDGTWGQVDAGGNHYDYTFNADGTFASLMQPACLFAQPMCAIRIAQHGGTFKLDGAQLHLTYTSTLREGAVADFALAGEGRSARLIGNDFDQPLSLSRTTR